MRPKLCCFCNSCVLGKQTILTDISQLCFSGVIWVMIMHSLEERLGRLSVLALERSATLAGARKGHGKINDCFIYGISEILNCVFVHEWEGIY